MEIGLRIRLVKTGDHRLWVYPGMTGKITSVEIVPRLSPRQKINNISVEGDEFYYVRWDNGKTTTVDCNAGDEIVKL